MHSLLTFELFGGQIVLVRVALEAAAHFTNPAHNLTSRYNRLAYFFFTIFKPTFGYEWSMVSSLPSASAVAPRTLLRQHWSLPMTKTMYQKIWKIKQLLS